MLTSVTRGETLAPNPNECNSTQTSGTKNIYSYPSTDVNDWGHRLRIILARRRTDITKYRNVALMQPKRFMFLEFFIYSKLT